MIGHTGVRCGRGRGNCTRCGVRTWNSKTGLCRRHYVEEYEKFRDEGGISNVIQNQSDVTTIDRRGRIHGAIPLTFRLNLGTWY